MCKHTYLISATSYAVSETYEREIRVMWFREGGKASVNPCCFSVSERTIDRSHVRVCPPFISDLRTMPGLSSQHEKLERVFYRLHCCSTKELNMYQA